MTVSFLDIVQAVTLISAALITNLQQHLFINLGTQADAHKLCKLMWLPSCNWQELRRDTMAAQVCYELA